MNKFSWSMIAMIALLLGACGGDTNETPETGTELPPVVEMLELGCGGDSECLQAVSTHYDDCIDAVKADENPPADVASLTTAVSICIGERVNPKTE